MNNSSTALQKTVLIIGIIVGLFVASRALLSPEAMMNSLDISLNSMSAINEIRGQYGGFFLAFTIVLSLSLIGRLSVRLGLIVFLMTVGGVLIGRLFSLMLDGLAFSNYTPAIQVFFLIDAVMVGLALLAIRQKS